jgi:S1-C subfamily serine protease
MYVGRTTAATDPRTPAPLYSLHALQYSIARGTPIFTLDGIFLGLVDRGETTASVLTGEFLRTLAESAVRTSPPMPASVGLHVQDASVSVLRATGAARGVVVSYVEPGGPADGVVQVGDVIHAVDGTAVATAAEFQNITGNRRSGERVSLDFVRRAAATQAVVVARGHEDSPGDREDELGLIGRAVADAGIEVISLQLHRAAERAGLRRGDLIVTVNGQPARDMSALANAYKALSPQASVLISVQRGDQHVVLALEKP